MPAREPATDPRPPRRPRLTILVKLLAAFVVPTALLFAGFAFFAHEVAREELETELGRRLAKVAAATATQIRGRHLVDLDIGDEQDRAYLFNKRKLETVAAETGVARVYVFDRDYTVKVATDPESPVGSEHFYAQLHRAELERVFEGGTSVSTVLFTGADGKQYLAGYAPVRASETDDEIVLALGVDAAPAYFDRLAELRRSLYLYGAILMLVVIAIAVLVAALITRPVRALAAAAERIGHGQLDTPVERLSRDEIGFLATTMERMRRDLRARDERMQMMLAGVAHEVRNPLGGMKLFTGILDEELADEPDKREHVARVARELGYLETVVSEFLDYARRPVPEMDAVRAAEIARDVAELVGGAAEERGVTVDVEAGGSDAAVTADAGQLRRAVLNLARNAVEAAGGEGGRVRIEVSRAGGEVVISVRNTGEPIDEAAAERIFEPFYTTKEKGTGLGLAFAAEIARDHGGTIDARRDGDETVFTISLPAR